MFLIIKVILFFIALCVAPFKKNLIWAFFFLFFFPPAFPLISLVLCRALLIFVILLSFQCFFLGFFIYFFYQCSKVTLCDWWYVKIQELSLDQSTHLFLVMFFLAHHRAPFCSEYFPFPPPPPPPPFFPTHIMSVVLFSCASFLHGIFTCVNVLHFHSFF